MAEGHRSVSNDSSGKRAPKAAAAQFAAAPQVAAPTAPPPSPLPTQLESVPGYRPRGLAGTRLRAAAPPGGLEALAVAEAPVAPPPIVPVIPTLPVRDAAEAAFGTVPRLEMIIGADDRRVVTDVEEVPWRFICALRITTGNGELFVGTGWFISPRTVMTAGHCVYLHDYGGWARSIEVIPALDGQTRPYGAAAATKFRAVDSWTSSRDPDFDYGAILLEQNDDLGTQTGWFAFAALDDATLVATDANISGYPADRDQATRQYYSARKIMRTSPQQLFYDIDTMGGQSGSPIWLQVDGQRVAVGVHTTGATTTNSGTRIIKEVFDNMKAWKT